MRDMSSLGEDLRTAREARGLTLSDAAEHIHIRSVYLAAIEAEDWPAIGAPVYVRGFIRTYARFLGLNPEEAIARFVDRVPSESPTQVATALASMAAAPERRPPSFGALAGIIVALVLVAFVGYEYYTYKTGTAGPVATGGTALASAPAALAAAPSPSAALAAPAPSTTVAGSPGDEASAVPDGSDSPGPAASDGLEEPSPVPMAKDGIQIRLAARSWIRVVIDGKTALEGIFPAGTMRTFSGKTAVVRAGNAAGVEVSVGGRSQGAMGGPGDVVERSYHLSQPE
jgi:cytoskeleton protein RodZ